MIAMAAIKYNDMIYIGKRHAWIMRDIRKIYPNIPCIKSEQQGFITDDGKFISDRFEAAKIAIECGQITEMKYPGMGLDSEEVCIITQEDIDNNK